MIVASSAKHALLSHFEANRKRTIHSMKDLAQDLNRSSTAPTVLQRTPESTFGLVRHVAVRPRCGRLSHSFLVQRSGHDGQGETLNSLES